MRPKAARGRAQRAPTNLPECSRLFAGAALCSRPQAFPPEGGRWHGEAVTDEGAYLNRNLYPGGSPKGLPYPGPQSPHLSRGGREAAGGFPFPTPLPEVPPYAGVCPPCNRSNVKKIPSAVEQFPPRRGCQRIKRISPPSNRKRGGHVVLQEVSSFILS